MELHQDTIQASDFDYDTSYADEETLVVDYRGGTRSAHAAERKFFSAMQQGAICLSQLNAFTKPGDR